MRYTVTQLLECLHDEELQVIPGSPEIRVSKALSITEADEETMVWIKPNAEKAVSLISDTLAKLIICDEPAYLSVKEKKLEKAFLLVREPRRIFSKIVNTLFVKLPAPGIHPTAFVHPKAIIGNNCYIGPFVYIDEAIIGANTILHGHCHVYNKVTIGSNCIIHAGVVIGSDGFGYTRDEVGNVEKFPHIGGVIIGDDVEVGSNTCIDRGSLGNTVIENGVKIDNLVHIAHNVLVQPNAFIIANAMIGGSTRIGKGAWVAPSASLLQQLHIGDHATIGVGAVVTKDVPAGETWTGTPARPLTEFLAQQKKIKNMP